MVFTSREKRQKRYEAGGEVSLPRFFIGKEQIDELSGLVTITGDDAHHIARSLRMAAGEHVTVCDSQKTEYDCELLHFEDDRVVTARIVSAAPMMTEPPISVTLYQALPKGDKLDTVIQKAVECGVSEITPFESERCIVKVKPDAEEKKTQRRQRISEEASKQCGRSVIPEVKPTVSFDEMLERASQCNIIFFCYEGDGTKPLGRLLPWLDEFKKAKGEYPTVAVVIGSEGGFSLAEVEKARARGFILTGLGRRILRTETAPLFILSSIVCFTELT